MDMNLTDNDGWTPAMAAAFWAQLPVLDLLAKSGADFDVKTKHNKTLLGRRFDWLVLCMSVYHAAGFDCVGLIPSHIHQLLSQ